MAAAMLSMSESFQTSISILHQLNPQQKDQLSPQPKGIGFCVQVLLVSALFGIEMVVAFEQIYLILFHQFLGVPVSLLSVNGIICGAISMMLLPIMGYCSDKGANPKKRKLLTLFVGMSTFLGGLLILAIAGLIKLQSLDAIIEDRHETDMSNATRSTKFSSTAVDGLNISLDDLITSMTLSTDTTLRPNTTAQVPNTDTGEYSQIPVTAIMSIIGFAMIDIGFDMSISLTRAFIIESTSPFQHTRLLVMATIAASMAGTTFSFLGCFDFPRALGALFHVEGVAVTLVFFCTLLCCIIIVGYSCTTITGFMINRKPQETDTGLNRSDKHLSPPVIAKNQGASSPSRRRLIKERNNLAARPYVPDILHTEEGDASTRPLLLEDSLRTNSYAAMSISTSSLYPSFDTQEAMFARMETHYVNTSIDNISNENTDVEAKEECASELDEDSDAGNKDKPANNTTYSTLAAVKQSHSLSTSVVQPPLGDFHSRKLEHLQNKQSQNDKENDQKLFLNKRLIILCCSCFFTFGSMITFIIYISNALNIGIFHGDPTALPGTEAYDLYQSGLRIAALGNLVLYLTYMVISINNARLINLIGEKAQFVGCHVLLIVSLTSLIVTQRVEVYFVFMVCCGAFRTCVFTLPFVLANKFTQGEALAENTSGEPKKNSGKVMSLIGFLIPTHCILVSAFMGPLMEATGSVWVPLIYSLCASTMSLIIFIPLFFVKN